MKHKYKVGQYVEFITGIRQIPVLIGQIMSKDEMDGNNLFYNIRIINDKFTHTSTMEDTIIRPLSKNEALIEMI